MPEGGEGSAGSPGATRFDADAASQPSPVAGARRVMKLDQDLASLQELLQRIFETVPLMITVYEPSTKVLRVNRAFERLVGWSSEELGGVSLMEKVYPDPEYREQARQYMQACRAEWRDFCVTTRDGRQIESSWTNLRLSDDTQLGIGIDITERKRAEEKLRRSEERFQLAAMATHDAMWDLDLRTGKLWWSESINPVYGHQGIGAELELRDWANLVHDEDRDRVLSCRARALLADRTSPPLEYRFRRGDGSHAHILERSLVVRDSAGEPVRMVGTMTDVTISRQTEAALRESEEALRRAHDLKDEFLAMLAHELRNPLAAMFSAVHILGEDRPPAGAAEQALTILTRQLGFVNRLVNDLLDVSRINTGKISLQRSALDVAAVVQTAVESSRPFFAGKRQQLKLEPGPGGPLFVDGDSTRLEQVFANLLHNAAKFTPPLGAIDVSVDRQGDEVAVRVRDSGIGIPPEVLPRVFDLFVQADRGFDRAHDGLGIGLHLVERLVKLHGGRVEAFSRGQGLGSEFVVRLPVLPAATASDSAAERAAGRETGRSDRRTILVVDDNVDAALALSIVLSRQGDEVLMAHDARSALELAKTRDPDTIVMDLGMPGMSGYDLARLVRADPQLDHVRLVALTGWGQEEARRESARAGIDHHLVKPVDLAVLRELIARPRPAARVSGRPDPAA